MSTGSMKNEVSILEREPGPDDADKYGFVDAYDEDQNKWVKRNWFEYPQHPRYSEEDRAIIRKRFPFWIPRKGKESKQYTIKVPLVSASGWQLWTTEADSSEEALKRHKDGESKLRRQEMEDYEEGEPEVLK